uniref:PH domain-containing protein n=1 Tax=Cyprinodon variegatus TaxID=28743 RepID=A0A3Q2CQZ9_CYPVA
MYNRIAEKKKKKSGPDLNLIGWTLRKTVQKQMSTNRSSGSLLVCRDALSPPDQVVALHSCESIAEGREILDLPKLPPGGRRDCCFALILPQNKFLLLLSDSPDDCKWVMVTVHRY